MIEIYKWHLHILASPEKCASPAELYVHNRNRTRDKLIFLYMLVSWTDSRHLYIMSLTHETISESQFP